MPPRRKVPRRESSSASQTKQTSISDFFGRRPTRASLVATAPSPNPRQTASSSTKKTSTPRLTPRAATPRPVSSVAKAFGGARNNSSCSGWVGDESGSSSKDSIPTPMDVDVVSSPALETEMTQEELDVQEQLRSLECSRQSTESAEENQPSPQKRSRIEPSQQPTRGSLVFGTSTTKLLSTNNVSTPLTSVRQTSLEEDLSKTDITLANVTPPSITPNCKTPNSQVVSKQPSTSKAASLSFNTTNQSPKRSSPKRDYEQTKSPSTEDSDDDSYADLREYQNSAPRRSTRVSKETERLDPSPKNISSASGGSVFGNTNSQRKTLRSNNALKVIMQERNARCKEEKELEQLRQNIAQGDEKLGAGEELFHRMAHEEDEKERQRTATTLKYSNPLPLFVHKPNIKVITEAKRKKWTDGVKIHQIVALLRELKDVDTNCDIAISMIERCIDKMAKENRLQVPPRVVEMLIHLLVFDHSENNISGLSRDGLMTMLNVLIESNIDTLRSCEQIPSLSELLQAYGMEKSLLTAHASTLEAKPLDSSLDKSMPTKQYPDARGEYSIARRNVERAFLIASAQIRYGLPVKRVLGLNDGDNDNALLSALRFCSRILISPFGSRLYRGIGGMISTILAQVKREEWPQFRFEAAKTILSHSTCIGLHYELAQFLLPHHTKRGRSLALDIAYLSLCQWYQGPAPNPIPSDISSIQPSPSAQAHGLKYVSYCMADISRLARGIPEVRKDTDVQWAKFVAQILKTLVADPRVLNAREKGDISSLHQEIQKLRQCSNRMGLDAAIPKMRMALDATLITIRNMCGKTHSDRLELIPTLLQEKTQTSLASLVRSS